MAYKIKTNRHLSAEHRRNIGLANSKDVKYRTIKNFKALKDFEFHEIKDGKMYFKKKRKNEK